MKIIGRYKDFYDYLQGVYGIDSEVILDRSYIDLTNEVTKLPLEINRISDGKVKEVFEDIDFSKQPFKEFNGRYWNGNLRVMIGLLVGDQMYLIETDNIEWRSCFNFFRYVGKVNYTRTSANVHPVEIVTFTSHKDFNYLPKNPDKIEVFSNFLIKDTPFIGRINPIEVWTELYNYLCKVKTVEVPNQSNDSKIQSHGFDLKESFRGKVKPNK